MCWTTLLAVYVPNLDDQCLFFETSMRMKPTDRKGHRRKEWEKGDIPSLLFLQRKQLR